MENGLSFDEIQQACQNIGYDLNCAACSEIFFTGQSLSSHSCKDGKTHSVIITTSSDPPLEEPPVLDIKQWILYRADLKMRRGKIVAQCAHASMKVFFDNRIEVDGYFSEGVIHKDDYVMCISLNEEMKAWAEGSFGKVVLSVPDLDNLLLAAKMAEEAGLPVAVITDAGRTEFHGVPTITAIAIGPARCQDAWPIVRDGPVSTKLD